MELPDIQKTKPMIFLPIQQVGVENVEVPFKLQSRDSKVFHETIANVSMRTNLDMSTKGISMSRLIRTLKDFLDLPLKQSLISAILSSINTQMGSTDSYIRFSFRLPMKKKSIISDNEFPLYYKCSFEGQLKNRSFRFFQRVIIQYATYCPCSAELSKDLETKGQKGFPHAQRAFVLVLVEVKPEELLWLEDIIETVEKGIFTLPYPIIKREDEQELARLAANNPLFVEDAIRIICASLNEVKQIQDYYVKCVHEESIHTSEAIAICYKNVEGGFDGSYDIIG